jgi:hypothetical protein
MIGSCIAAVAAFLSSPTGLTQQFFLQENRAKAIAVVAPLGSSASREANSTFASLARMRQICADEGLQMKARIVSGLQAADGTELGVDGEPGSQAVMPVTMTLEFVSPNPTVPVQRRQMIFTFVKEGKRWRLTDVEVLDLETPHKEGRPTRRPSIHIS